MSEKFIHPSNRPFGLDEDAPIEKVYELLKMYKINFENKPIKGVLTDLSMETTRQLKTVRATLGGHAVSSIYNRMGYLHRRLIGMEIWPFSDDVVCPKLIGEIFHLEKEKYDTPLYIYYLKRIESDYGIENPQQNLIAVQKLLFKMLHVIESAKEHIIKYRRDVDESHFASSHLFMKRILPYGLWIFIEAL
jgi:hypothetical protein